VSVTEQMLRTPESSASRGFRQQLIPINCCNLIILPL